MKRSDLAFTTVAIGVAACVLLMFSAFGVNAHPTLDQGNAGHQKWEYCSITPVGRSVSYRNTGAIVVYFTDAGRKQEIFVASGPETTFSEIADAFGRAVAKLSQDGWELVCEGRAIPEQGSLAGALYFKRPRQ